jgi:ABC-type nitrate/sulfonate/bicarbonate transport system substrate-binding protein
MGWAYAVRRKSRALAAAAVCVVALYAGAAPHAGAAGMSSPTALVFNSDGTPDLHGLTIHMGNAAGDTHLADTVVYITVQKLRQWGANADLQLGNSNTTELAVVSGQLNATAGPMPTCLNAGLNIFGNNQVHVDYVIVSKTLSSLGQLKGHMVAIATDASTDNFLLDNALADVHLTRNDVKIDLTGSSSASVNQMLLGRVDAAFIHADGLLKLNQTGHFNVLGSTADIAPWYADSYFCATPAWLKANPATAEALDLAWLSAAKVFDTDKAGWVRYAMDYTKHAHTDAEAAAAYDALKTAKPWPDDGSGMSLPTLKLNYDFAAKKDQLKGEGNRPLMEWADTAPWNAAVKQFKSHEAAY